MIKNILVPYDFTNFAELAFEKAIEIGEKFDSTITLLTVIGSDIDTSGMNYSRAKESSEEMENKIRSDLNDVKTSRQIKNMDILADTIHVDSNIDGILSYEEKNDTDLIIMGSHGRSGFQKLVLGSVASGVTSKANCAVMIVKPSNHD